MGKVTESIFDGDSCVIPLADVVFVERDKRKNYIGNINIIFKGTTWNSDIDTWNNNSYLVDEEADKFMTAWCNYRHEIERETIADLTA